MKEISTCLRYLNTNYDHLINFKPETFTSDFDHEFYAGQIQECLKIVQKLRKTIMSTQNHVNG